MKMRVISLFLWVECGVWLVGLCWIVNRNLLIFGVGWL